MATYPPQGLQSGSSFTSLSMTGKSLAAGSNINLAAVPGGLQLTSGGSYLGVPQVTLAPNDFITTVSGVTSTPYNASARFLTYTYTPSSNFITSGLFIELIYYITYQTTLVNTSLTTYVNVYVNSIPSPLGSIFNWNATTSTVYSFDQSTMTFIYTPSGGLINSPVTLNVCAFTSNTASNNNVILSSTTTRSTNTSTPYPLAGLCPTALSVTPIYQ